MHRKKEREGGGGRWTLWVVWGRKEKVSAASAEDRTPRADRRGKARVSGARCKKESTKVKWVRRKRLGELSLKNKKKKEERKDKKMKTDKGKKKTEKYGEIGKGPENRNRKGGNQEWLE